MQNLQIKQIKECEKRLQALVNKGLFKEAKNTFNNGDVGLFDMNTFYFVKGNMNGSQEFTEYWNKIQDFEQKYNSKVYLATITYTEFGKLLNLFYVSDSEEEWELDNADLHDGYPVCYVINLDEEVFSEFGSIGIKINKAFGSIERVA